MVHRATASHKQHHFYHEKPYIQFLLRQNLPNTKEFQKIRYGTQWCQELYSLIYMWDLWWKKWHWDKFFSEYFNFPFVRRSTTMVHTHISFLYHQRHINKMPLCLFPNTAINFCVTQFRSSTQDLCLILLKLFSSLQGHYSNDWKLKWRNLVWFPMAWFAYKVLRKYIGCKRSKERQAARRINSHISLPFLTKKNWRWFNVHLTNIF
jgi:hypothetical protein